MYNDWLQLLINLDLFRALARRLIQKARHINCFFFFQVITQTCCALTFSTPFHWLPLSGVQKFRSAMMTDYEFCFTRRKRERGSCSVFSVSKWLHLCLIQTLAEKYVTGISNFLYIAQTIAAIYFTESASEQYKTSFNVGMTQFFRHN